MLSLITVNYNNQAGLKRTIESIRQQVTSFPYEHIIIDGASTDNSCEIATNYQADKSRVIFQTGKDRGIYDAMNKGLKVATGSHVAFLNSGDILASEDVLQVINSVLENDSAIDLLYGDICFTNNEGHITRQWVSGSYKRSRLYYGWMPPHPMTTIRTSLISKLKNFDERLRISADYDLMLQVLLSPGKIVHYVPRIFVYMETGGVSNGTLRGVLNSNVEVIKSWLKIRGYFTPYWIFLTKPLTKIFQLRVGRTACK